MEWQRTTCSGPRRSTVQPDCGRNSRAAWGDQRAESDPGAHRLVCAVANTGVVLQPRLVGKITGEFLVPSYQRGYRWGRHEVEQLLNDIRDSVGDYYLQPVVVRAGDKLELIDGQQRLTTLYLILRYIKQKHLPSAEVGYTLEYETRPLSRAFLEEPDPTMSGTNIDFFHIHQAATCIEEWFDEQDEPTTALDFYLNGLQKRVYVIWYEVADDVDARDLFTRLNIGRIPLTDAELVKAVLLSNVTRPEEVAAQWDNIERDLRHDDVWAFVAPRRPGRVDADRPAPRHSGGRAPRAGSPEVRHVRTLSERARQAHPGRGDVRRPTSSGAKSLLYMPG